MWLQSGLRTSGRWRIGSSGVLKIRTLITCRMEWLNFHEAAVWQAIGERRLRVPFLLVKYP
jgi:hypothetical protein